MPPHDAHEGVDANVGEEEVAGGGACKARRLIRVICVAVCHPEGEAARLGERDVEAERDDAEACPAARQIDTLLKRVCRGTRDWSRGCGFCTDTRLLVVVAFEHLH